MRVPWEILQLAIMSTEAITINRFGKLWRTVIAFVVSLVLNGFLLVVAFSVDPRQEKLSGIQRVANVLLEPAGGITDQLVPGHGGTQIFALILFSVLIYALLAWVVLSLPVWWRHRA